MNLKQGETCMEISVFCFSLPLEQPIVVIGDRSASMEVAIRTSTIIASLLTAITSAKLVFFNRENMDAEFIPKTINEVLIKALKRHRCPCIVTRLTM